MKKIFLLMICMLSYHVYYSQTQSHNVGVTQPVPSVSSLAAYNNIPVSLQTGVPNISYPLINLPTNSKFVNINLGLSYHTGNISKDSWAGEVGKGWSVLGSGVISREILSDIDEVFDDVTFHHYVKNQFDDIYNFNIPGESGKFKVVRDIVNNTFQIVKLSPYTSKLEYTRTSNTATLIFDSFTITSDEGIKYKFQDYNISTMNVWLWEHPSNGMQYADRKYRSAFYLTSILDENDQELVKYSYIKDMKYFPGTPITQSETNKLTRIEVKDRGIVEINYTKNELLNVKNDIFGIDNIVLKTVKNILAKKYKFNYLYTPYRTLNSFSQVDSNENDIEKTSFDYEIFSSPPSNGGQLFYNALKKVKLPTGGTVEYNFDLVPYAFKDSLTTVMPQEIDVANVSFNQFNSSLKKYFFTVAQDKELNIDILANQISAYPWSLSFFKKVGSNYQPTPYVVGPVSDVNPDYPTPQNRTFTAGEYYVSLLSADANASFNTQVNFRAFYYDGAPTQVYVKVPTEAFLRVKNIKSFNLNSTDVNNLSVPSKIEEYDYNKFDDPTVSSGFFVDGGTVLGNSESGLVAYNPSTIYKNVKVSNGNNTGYTKYYFKTIDTYPTQPTEDNYRPFWPNYNIMRDGLLDKKEIYNATNQKLAEENFEYSFEEFNAPRYLTAPSLVGGNYYLKTTWIKNQKVISKTYHNSAISETTAETTNNSTNYKTSLEKMTSFDGSIQETTYQYALDKNNQKLINANIIGIPLETTTIRKKNAADAGKLISKTEKKYDNPINNYPASVVSFDARTNNMVTEATFNKYDSKGNLLQYTTKEGTPVAVVWGYGGTLSIAKIEGATYDQISGYISEIVTKSDADVDDAFEQALVNALDTFRNLPALQNTQITTFVYDPLIGMKMMTPPAGIREIYKYDTAGRLDQVVDENGKVLKKYKYNYKH